jgi:serine/threonine-protein kinase
LPGEVLDGKYRIERILGEGGMGMVVAARHLTLDQRVAIKFARPDIASRPNATARFLQEARAAAKIRGEHVARVFDAGTLDGSPYMVMEYLEGRDLSSVLCAEGCLRVDAAIEYVLQACVAIAEAHAAGIVHRDLKPGNLFVTQRADGSPCMKVLDFGISKVSGTNAEMTHSSVVLGSPLYMSPEQLESARDVDARTDVWSLGVILFELVTGQRPFIADSLAQLCVMTREAPAPSMRNLHPEIPAELDEAVRRCLEKNRDMRYADVGELAMALAPFAPKRARASALAAARLLERASQSDMTGTLASETSSHMLAESESGPTDGALPAGGAALDAEEEPRSQLARPRSPWTYVSLAIAVVLLVAMALAWKHRVVPVGASQGSLAAETIGPAGSLVSPQLPTTAEVPLREEFAAGATPVSSSPPKLPSESAPAIALPRATPHPARAKADATPPPAPSLLPPTRIVFPDDR